MFKMRIEGSGSITCSKCKHPSFCRNYYPKCQYIDVITGETKEECFSKAEIKGYRTEDYLWIFID